VESLASQVRAHAAGAGTPVWARHGSRPAPDVLADVAVWRAATGVAPEDLRPTGAPQLQKAAACHQRRLDERVNAGKAPALAEWGPLIDALHPHRDQFTALLAERLAAISRIGLDAAALLRTAAAEGPLPDDHLAAALWWRISRHLSPAVATTAGGQQDQITTGWSDLLIDTLGADRAGQLTTSPWWPTLVASVDQAEQRGWPVTELLDIATTIDPDDIDLAQAMVWRIAIFTDPPPEPGPDDHDPPPDDLDQAVPVTTPVAHDTTTELDQVAAERELLDPLQPSDADVARDLARCYAWDHSPVTGDRILAINEMAACYYQSRLPGSWAHTHLRIRLGQDLTGDPQFRPGYAPAGWTNLTAHLRARGVSDEELLAAGLAKTASTGRLIDRFRNRVILPVISNTQVLGFIGRRHPDAGDDTPAGPKYLNTPDTTAFHKGAQLYGIPDPDLARGSVPVLVEGPLDAIAVTLATAGAYLGVAPLGTSLTTEQAAQLSRLGTDPIVATDGDLAGWVAAERDYWLLTPHGLDPRFARLGPGDDPASLLTDHGPTPLRAVLHEATPLADSLLQERISNLPTRREQLTETAQVIAAQRPARWQQAITSTAGRLRIPAATVGSAVATAGRRYNSDRRRATSEQVLNAPAVRARLEAAANATPADRWAPLARGLNARLVGQRDWPATAAMLDLVHQAGHDVHTLTRLLVNHTPLGESPAQDLRYRLLGYLPDATVGPAPAHHEPSRRSGAQHQRLARTNGTIGRPTPGPPR
jgi:DNA primase catalytic core